MSNLSGQLSQVVEKTTQILALHALISEKKDLLELENQSLKAALEVSVEKNKALEEKMKILQVARSLAEVHEGEVEINEKSVDIKKKIDEFVREIDKCIDLLK